ncbi:hypothetical protein AVEN_196139-1 [Araneus ventricosus]|uniref:Uncharacterized protein n=1 Tax=Araneus ventricosus TaxID=182803 RepID=A0A4Y2E1D7_ARAVE|nr:hypothetical protein AVEN_196139-1 [Araneus ventricosus]
MKIIIQKSSETNIYCIVIILERTYRHLLAQFFLYGFRENKTGHFHSSSTACALPHCPELIAPHVFIIRSRSFHTPIHPGIERSNKILVIIRPTARSGSDIRYDPAEIMTRLYRILEDPREP